MPSPPEPAMRVALFRAREDAAGSAERLRDLGFDAAFLPAFAIAPRAVQPMRRRYDAVIATSANAFLGDLPVDRGAPLYVVGGRTARAAERLGWRLAAPPALDSTALIQRLEQDVAPDAALLYLAGRDRKPAIEAALGGLRALEVVEAYAAEARAAWTPQEAAAFAACAAALHYSRRSAALAATLAEGCGEAAHFRALTHVCLSADAAQPLLSLGAPGVRIAAAPDEERLFDALIQEAAVFSSHWASRI